jgi:hypothetical protein
MLLQLACCGSFQGIMLVLCTRKAYLDAHVVSRVAQYAELPHVTLFFPGAAEQLLREAA